MTEAFIKINDIVYCVHKKFRFLRTSVRCRKYMCYTCKTGRNGIETVKELRRNNKMMPLFLEFFEKS